MCDSMATVDQEPDGTWESLPQGLLQAISSGAPWSDCLASRLVCKSWSAAIGPLIHHLRVHVAPGCSSTAVAGPPPVQLLQRALVRLPRVTSMELVLTCHTLGPQLKDVLHVLGSQVQVEEVHIWEVPAVQGVAQLSSRDYAASLQLSVLRHVSVLSIRSPVTWSLQDIWDQICCTDTGQGASLLTSLESLSLASLRSQQRVCVPPFKPASDSLAVLPNLKHLVTPLPGQKDSRGAVSCTLAASHDGYLRGLAAGLPRLQTLKVLDSFQGNTQVVQHFGSLVELHMCVGGLLRSLADLPEEELSITEPFMSIKHLQRLDLMGAEGMKLPVKLEWLTAAAQLQHLTACVMQSSKDISKVPADQLQSLCALHVPKCPELLAQIAAVGQGLTALTLSRAGPEAFAVRSAFSFRRDAVTLQPYLTTFGNLHSLSVLSDSNHLAFTVQDPETVWRAMPGLRCLSLQGVGLGYTPQGEPLPGRHISDFVCDVDTAAEYQAWVRKQDKLRDLVVLWIQDLPKGLQQLKLSRYLLVISESDVQPKSQARAVHRQGFGQQGVVCHTRNSSSNGNQSLTLADCMAVVAHEDDSTAYSLAEALASGTLWLEGLLTGSVPADSEPLHREVVVSPSKQLAVVAAAAAALRSEARSDMGLQPYASEASPSPSWVVQGPPKPEQYEQTRPRDPHYRVGVDADLLRMLNRQQLSQLHNLQLLHVSAPWGAALLADSYQQLQRLCIKAASYDTATQQQQAWLASSNVQGLAAAGLAGCLQQLTQLELDFGQSGKSPVDEYQVDDGQDQTKGPQLHDGCGIGAMRLLCSSLKGLIKLKVTLDLAQCSLSACASECADVCNPCNSCLPRGAAEPARKVDSRHYHCMPFDALNVDASIVFKEILQEPLCSCKGSWVLSNWGRLRVLDATVLVPSLHVLGRLGPGVLGRCDRCGGGLGLEAVRWFVKHSVPDALPACEVMYQEQLSFGGLPGYRIP